MTTEQQIEEWRRAAEYHAVCITLRGNGLLSIFAGLLATGLGVLATDAYPFNVFLVVIGTLLTAAGVWNVGTPAPTGAVLNGVILSVVGLCGFVGFGLVKCLRAALIGSYYQLACYPRFRDAFREKPEEGVVREMGKMLVHIRRARLRDNPDIIEFIAFRPWPQRWKVKLIGDLGLFVTRSGLDAEAVTRVDLDIEQNGALPGTKLLYITVQLGERVLHGIASAESFDRYIAWRTGTAAVSTCPPIAASIVRPPELW